jgi:nucleoside-diphosphate kinase
MATEKTLVLLKPDAMAKNLQGSVLTMLTALNLKTVGFKLVKVNQELAARHYVEHKEKPFYGELMDHIMGKLHGGENVIAICYKGENAVQKIREVAGAAHPEKAELHTIRGRFGRVHSETGCFENVVHTSDSQASAAKEIELWFRPEEILD